MNIKKKFIFNQKQQERKLEMLEKNHKHEIGVEMAHHRDVKRRFLMLTEEHNELKVRLEVSIFYFY
jgi:hypothetical protein